MKSILSLVVACLAGLTLAGSVGAAPIAVSGVTASSTFFTYNVNNLINGAGLGAGGLHSGAFQGKWMTDRTTTGTLTFDLGAVYELDSTKIWNYGPGCCGVERSTKDLDIEVSLDGISFTALTSVMLAQAVGDPFAGETVGLLGATAQFVRFDLNAPYRLVEFIGLSEVQFFGAAVPEPGTMLMVGAAMLVMLTLRRRGRRGKAVRIESKPSPRGLFRCAPSMGALLRVQAPP